MKGNNRLKAAIALGAFAALCAALAITVAGALSGSAVPVTVGGVKPEKPAVSGSRVVWSDYRQGQWDIWLYDRATNSTRQITSGTGDKLMPAISGDTVVYVKYAGGTGGDVFAYNVATSQTATLSADAGDQLNPTISGRWVAWEDYSSGYSPKVMGYDLQAPQPAPAFIIDSGYGIPKRAPKAAGDVLVYESLSRGVTADSDVKIYNFATAVRTDIAATTSDERMPATDGRYVAWMQSNPVSGYDIYAYDTQSGGAPVAVATDPGEQSVPAVANGVVYWYDANNGLALKTYNLSSGAKGKFAYSGNSAVTGLSANGDAVTWLQQVPGRWQVKALFATPAAPLSIASILPAAPAWRSFRLATLSTGGDTEAPAIMYASVRPGQRNVSGTAPITVHFSERMNPATIDSGSVKLVDARTRRAVSASVTYSNLGKSAVITPAEPLALGTYTLEVAPSVADPAGNLVPTGLQVSFSTTAFAPQASYAPSAVNNPTIRIVSQNATVTMNWTAASDDVGVTGYYVKRYSAPIDSSNFSAATTLTPVGAGSPLITSLTATFAPAVDEVAKKSTYYYTVLAVDADGQLSPSWYNTVPDPHGTYVLGKNTINCSRCHNTHGGGGSGLGKLAARGAKACYQCHGSTNNNTAYGYASVNNVQKAFWDYSANPMPTTASRHGNAYIRAQDDNQQCDMCHSPHKKPYSSTTSASYNKLLKKQSSAADASSAVVYGTDAAPLGKDLCFECHGSGAVETGSAPFSYMYTIGGSTAFDNAAGDHNEANWTAAKTTIAHGSAELTDAVRATGYGQNNPTNECQVCHNEHGSDTGSLLDYRRSGNATGLASAGEMCFKCHSTGTEAGAPNTWNSRNVKAEFARSGSRHPYSTGTSYASQESLATPGTIDTQTDFTTWTTVSNVSLTDVAGSAALSHPTVDPTSGPYVFYVDNNVSPVGPMDSFKDGQAAWDLDFSPTNIGTNPGSGANSTTRAGLLFAMQGGGSNVTRYYTPPANSGTGTWATSTNLWQNANTGSDMALDSTHGYIWALVGGWTVPSSASTGGTNIRRTSTTTGNALTWYAPGTYDGPIFRVGGTNQSLGAGSTLAWVPANGTRLERLYVVNRYGTTTRDGLLYYYDNPDAAVGGTNWTSTTHVLGSTGTTSDTGSRMAYFRIGTTDYLYFMRGASTQAYMVTLANTTAAAGTLTSLTNPFGANVADGASLVWNGDTTQAGFRLYAVQGGSTSFKVATWNGSALVWANGPALTTASGAGSYLGLVNADPAPSVSSTYNTAGTMMITNVAKAAGDTNWSHTDYTATVPANSTLTLNVRDGVTHADLLGTINITGTGTTDLSSLSNSSLEFLYTFSNSVNTVTPQIDLVTVSSSKTVAVSSGKMTCYNCHNTHFVASGTAGTAWSMTRVSDPTDTNGAYAGDSTTFCIKCHTGSVADGSISIASVFSAAKLVPYAIQLRASSAWPYFTGWNKSGFTASGHYTTTGTKALCENCHDPHGSNNKSLLAWTKPSTYAAGNAGVRDNTTVAAQESNICWQCHGNSGITIGGFVGKTGTGAGGVRMDIATPYNRVGTNAWKHDTTVIGDHFDAETASNFSGTARHAQCVDCHDPHATRQVASTPVHTFGSSQAGAALYGVVGVKPTFGATNWTSPSAYTTIRLASNTTDYEAYVCFKCHSGNTTLPTTGGSGAFGATDLALEFNPNNQAGHNVMGGTTVWPKSTVASGLPYAFAAFPTGTFTGATIAGVSVTSKLTCTDCHTSDTTTDARGPHGSASKFMLRSGGNANWYDTTLSTWSTATSNFCKNCHGTMGSNNVHSRGEHSNYACRYCHVKIPHGWKRPRLLVYQPDTNGATQAGRDAAPYSSLESAGLREIAGSLNQSNATPGYRTGASSWSDKDCYAGCDTGTHPDQPNPW